MPHDLFRRVEALPDVSDAVAEARSAVDRLLSHRVLRRRSAEVSSESVLRGARASAALDGADISLEAMRAAMSGAHELPARVAGALQVAASLGELTPVWGQAPRQALARLHVLAISPGAPAGAAGDPHGASAAPVGEPGRPRSEAPAEDPLGLGAAPDPREVGARLGGLLEAVLQPSGASALVVAAVVHAELLALRPFGTADGVVARAAARMVLVGRGLDPKAVTQPEVGYLEQGGYVETAQAYVAGDPRRFVLHTCAAVALGAREGLAVAEALQREG